MKESFKDALYELVHRSELPAKALAEQIGQSYQMLVNCANPNLEKWNLRGDKIVPLTNASRNYVLLDYMERVCGRVAFSLPRPGASLDRLYAHLTSTVSEFGDLLKKFEEIVEDGRITRAERIQFEREAYEAIQEIVAFVEAIKRS